MRADGGSVHASAGIGRRRSVAAPNEKEEDKAKSEVVAPSIDSRLGPIVARRAEGGTRVKAACGVDEHALA